MTDKKLWQLKPVAGVSITEAPVDAVKMLLWLEQKGIRCVAMGSSFIAESKLPPKAQQKIDMHENILCQLVKYCNAVAEQPHAGH